MGEDAAHSASEAITVLEVEEDEEVLRNAASARPSVTDVDSDGLSDCHFLLPFRSLLGRYVP